ncbi:MAG: hypothetical protein K2X53_03215 [Alphaproteobacteria bacterium]|nr:hypothetical protein [Alphaproteobacteria bacterium]
MPEYWGPKDLIHRFLMSSCGGTVADDLMEIEKIEELPEQEIVINMANRIGMYVFK